jgi:hypothetical protein
MLGLGDDDAWHGKREAVQATARKRVAGAKPAGAPAATVSCLFVASDGGRAHRVSGSICMQHAWVGFPFLFFVYILLF